MAQRIARRSRAERILAWFVPDLALTAAVATLVCLFALFDGASSLFRDSDAGWLFSVRCPRSPEELEQRYLDLRKFQVDPAHP